MGRLFICPFFGEGFRVSENLVKFLYRNIILDESIIHSVRFAGFGDVSRLDIVFVILRRHITAVENALNSGVSDGETVLGVLSDFFLDTDFNGAGSRANLGENQITVIVIELKQIHLIDSLLENLGVVFDIIVVSHFYTPFVSFCAYYNTPRRVCQYLFLQVEKIFLAFAFTL